MILGISHLNCLDSLLQYHKKQHSEPRVQVFFPHPESFPSSRSQLKVLERQGNGVGAKGSGTSLRVQHSARTRTHTWMTRDAAQEVERERKRDEDKNGVKIKGERWVRHREVKTRK